MEWISVCDRLPNDFLPVLVFISNSLSKKKNDSLTEQILLARYCYCKGWQADWDRTAPTYRFTDANGKEIYHTCRESFSGFFDITHWMPLPNPPG